MLIVSTNQKCQTLTNKQNKVIVKRYYLTYNNLAKVEKTSWVIVFNVNCVRMKEKSIGAKPEYNMAVINIIQNARNRPNVFEIKLCFLKISN